MQTMCDSIKSQCFTPVKHDDIITNRTTATLYSVKTPPIGHCGY